MKNMKRLVALMLVATLVITLFAGCQKKEAETITLTVYSQLANYSGELTGWFAQVLKEEFNVRMIIVPDSDGVYDTRMEAGDLGDIVIWGGDGDEYKRAHEAGLLFDWEEDDLLDEYGAYMKEHMGYALQKNRDISNGNLYGFGHNVATSSEDIEDFFYTWDIRWDLYEALGHPVVRDLDDYVELMADMKAIEPVDDAGNPTYAISLWPDWDGAMVMYVKSTATAYYGYDELGIGLYNTDNGAFYPALQEGGPYLEALKFYNNLYQRGLLDPDSMTQTFDEMAAKVQNGGTFFSIFNFSGSAAYNTEAHMADNKMMLTMTPEEASPIVYGMNVMGSNRVWSIGAKTQYPELCMEIINWLSTPEGRMTSEYGPKGITWDYDEEGYTYGTELGRLFRSDSNAEYPEETGYSGRYSDGSFQLNNTTWSINATNPDSNGETYNWDNWRSNQLDPVNETESNWRSFTGANTVQEYLRNRPYRIALGTAYSEGNRSDELKVKWEQVTKTIVDYSWRAIYATTDAEFDSIVAQMVADAEAYGYDECVEWCLNEAAIRKTFEDAVR